MSQKQENTEQPSSEFIEDKRLEVGRVVAIPQIYFNSFDVALSLSDANITLMTNGIKHSQLFLSYSTAKTLAEILNRHIQVLEEKTKQEIMTMDDIKEAIETLDKDSNQ